MKKRQVKAPKVYLRDTGLLHYLPQIPTLTDLQGHPKIGASWEGFAMEQIVHWLGTRDVYFWATHAGAELDLMVSVAGKRYGFEFKYTDAPSRQRSMHIAAKDLGLAHLWVVYPGDQKYALDEQITALSLAQALEKISGINSAAGR
jgi:predicted AAA+ superfamily ATPase